MRMLSSQLRLFFAGFFNKRRIFFTASLLIAALAHSAKADTFTYTYTSPIFTTYAGSYTSAHETRITGSFTVFAPIVGFITSAPIYDFTDGFNDFNQDNSFLQSFPINVDASGAVTSFATDIRNPNEPPGGGELALAMNDCDGSGCFSSYKNLSFIFATSSHTFGYLDPCGSGCAENNQFGVWSGPQVVVGTPEPSSILLLGVGLLGFLGRRKNSSG